MSSKKEENTYYLFTECDPTSSNYFKIYIDGSKIISNYDRNKFLFQMRPSDPNQMGNITMQVNVDGLVSYLNAWLKIIREYNDVKSVHDDNFEKAYSDFYFNEFKIFDKDADISPFDPNQQQIIELYLDSLTEGVQATELVTENEKNLLVTEIQQIKADLTINTKSQVMKKITKVFGKLHKKSKELVTEIVKETKKTLIKKLIELGIEYAPKLLELVTG